MSRKPKVVFAGVCRNSEEERASTQFARQWGDDVPRCYLVGRSCVATARVELGAVVATTMPSDTDVVVMHDSDVWFGPTALHSLVYRCFLDSLCPPRGPVVFASYPMRVPAGMELSDRRLCHYRDADGSIWGGLGMVAIPAPVFRHLHLNRERGPLVSPGIGIPESTCPYRAGIYDGRWITEDLYFCRELKLLGETTVFLPTVARHGARCFDQTFRMLDHSALLPDFVLSV